MFFGVSGFGIKFCGNVMIGSTDWKLRSYEINVISSNRFVEALGTIDTIRENLDSVEIDIDEAETVLNAMKDLLKWNKVSFFDGVRGIEE